jgi:hypothetical protein
MQAKSTIQEIKFGQNDSLWNNTEFKSTKNYKPKHQKSPETYYSWRDIQGLL